MLNKKAAIFGLDARIALAIFAVLGILTVAGMMITITQAKGGQVLSDLRAVEVAYRTFKQDTQYKLTQYSTNPYFYNTAELVTLTKDINKPYTVKYKGPYLDFKQGATTNFVVHPSTKNNIAIVSRRYNNWDTADKTEKCTGNDCFTWVTMFGLDCAIANEIDVAVDAHSTPNTGTVRAEQDGNKCSVHLIIEAE